LDETPAMAGVFVCVRTADLAMPEPDFLKRRGAGMFSGRFLALCGFSIATARSIVRA
jgi:hypothetical protein